MSKKTIYQRLNTIFGPDGVNIPKDQTNRYSIGKGELLKTQNKSEFEIAKLQAQQNKYMGQVWKKVDSELFQQAIHYETTRIGSYSDFENMEFYPEISAALDILMEESTTVNNDGNVLNIYSDSKRVKKILKDLFFNRLDIHTSLPMWTRNTAKYGDNFVYLNVDDKAGIVGGKQMPNFEMERREGDIYDGIINRGITSNDDVPDKIKFFWRGRDVEFNSWQIAHFRLLGDDRRLPYGTCLKYNTRVETATGYKEIKDIISGDLVYSFDVDSQNKRLSKVLDTVNSGVKKTCKISTAHNFIDVSKEHQIMYYNTDSQSFEYKNTLDFKIGDLLVVDSVNNNDNLIEIIKDKPNDNKNGYWNNINLIPDNVDAEFARLFGYLIGDGWIHNDSVHIALSEHKSINEIYISYLNKLTNREIRFSGGDEGKSQGICNSKMLSIILNRMGFVGNVYTKRIPQWVYSTTKEVRQAFLDGIIDADGSLFIDKWDCLRYSIELTNEELINDIKILVQSLGLKSGKISSRLRKNGGIGNRKFKSQKESFYFYFYDSKIKQKNIYDFKNRLTNDFILEPIKSIVDGGEHETYDIYVEDNNHNFYSNGIVVHNSVLEKARRIWKQLLLSEDAMLIYRVTRAPERRVYKIYVGNIDEADVQAYIDKIANSFKRTPITDPQTGQIDLKYNQMGNDQDIFIPVRSEDAQTPIDTLPGASNLDQIADIQYLQRKLFTALRVPKSFLGFEEPTGEGKNLALQDIRFSRTINRIQQAMIQELNKIAIIHLFILGFEDELDNFTLTLNNPSTQAEMLKVEHMQQKITLYKDSVSDAGNGFSPMSMTRAKREILGWSDDDIKQDLLEQRIERAASAELEKTENVIKHTGFFDKVDRVYGDIELAREGGGTDGEDDSGGGPSGGGGGFGGGGFGEEDIDFGEESTEGGEFEEGAEGEFEEGTEEFEGAEDIDFGEGETTEETIKRTENLLNEELKSKKDKLKKKRNKYTNIFLNKLSRNDDTKIINEKVKMTDKNITINENINNMMGDIDELLNPDNVND